MQICYRVNVERDSLQEEEVCVFLNLTIVSLRFEKVSFCAATKVLLRTHCIHSNAICLITLLNAIRHYISWNAMISSSINLYSDVY